MWASARVNKSESHTEERIKVNEKKKERKRKNKEATKWSILNKHDDILNSSLVVDTSSK